MIGNTVERQRAQHLWDTYFDPDSEHCLNWGMFEALGSYINEKEEKADELEKMFEEMGERLWAAMKEYDLKQL